MKIKKIGSFLIAIISLLLLFNYPVEAKFIKTFLIRIGGSNLSVGDEVKLAKYDLIICNKSHYNDIGGDSFGAIKAINPNSIIYLYTTVNVVMNTHDTFHTISLNELGRHGVSRAHSMGSLNGNHPQFFLTDAQGRRVTKINNSNSFLLDFGDAQFQGYSVEATITDHVNQPWTADGVFSDHSWSILSGDNSSTPLKYNTNAKWANAMNSMCVTMTAALNAVGQKYSANRGPVRLEDGYNAWITLDGLSNPPDMVLEESAFAVDAGAGEIQFFPEVYWKRQVDILRLIKNSDVCFQARTDLNPDESGTDNWGQNVTFWDGLWYALGSYLIGKNDNEENSYFKFQHGSYNSVDFYYDEYDSIDLGSTDETYHISNYDGTNIYWREFSRGYVYVNSTHKNVNSISLPELCKLRTHDNLANDLSALPDVNTINLNAHRAAILYKSGNLAPSSPPNNLRIEEEN